MQLSDLITTLEDLFQQNGDMRVELDSGKPVEEVDFVYLMKPGIRAAELPADAIVIK